MKVKHTHQINKLYYDTHITVHLDIFHAKSAPHFERKIIFVKNQKLN